MSITVQLSGLDEILRNIDSVAKLEGLQAAMLASGAHVKAKVDKYPRATEANSPDQKRWYERGYGPRWRRKDGSMGGRKTSEMLNRSWSIALRDSGNTLVVGSHASYSPYVHDRDKQAEFHKRRGWITIQAVGEQEAPVIIKFVADYMRRKFGMQ